MGESIGERIALLRDAKGWSRPRLGKEMAQAIGRASPYTGEQVRRYEIGKDKPPPDARRALAAVFDKTEQYIEFGEDKRQAPKGVHPDAVARDAREEILLLLYRGLFSLQQERLVASLRALFQANQITRKELGQKPLRGVSDEQVRAAFGDAPFTRIKRLEGKTSGPRRDPGTALDDFLEE
jgi:transcriptional regulator with XRE-family HTH domain